MKITEYKNHTDFEYDYKITINNRYREGINFRIWYILLNFATAILIPGHACFYKTPKDNENRISIFNHLTWGIRQAWMDLHENTAGSCSTHSFNPTLPVGRLNPARWNCSCIYHLPDDCNNPMVNVHGCSVCFRRNSADEERQGLQWQGLQWQDL